jgi:hypothetical protein
LFGGSVEKEEKMGIRKNRGEKFIALNHRLWELRDRDPSLYMIHACFDELDLEDKESFVSYLNRLYDAAEKFGFEALFELHSKYSRIYLEVHG